MREMIIAFLILTVAPPVVVAAPKYFRDAEGAYIGCFDGAKPPEGAVEVAQPPVFGGDLWDGAGWSPNKRQPQWEAFVDALEDDSTVPMQVYQYLGILQRNTHRPVRCAAVWAKIKTAGLPWLTAGAVAAIEARAVTYNVPLK